MFMRQDISARADVPENPRRQVRVAAALHWQMKGRRPLRLWAELRDPREVGK